MSRKEQGVEAEKIAMTYEKLRLGIELKEKVKYVGNRHGMGFDIQSINSDTDHGPRFIEVKSSSYGGYVFLTIRELKNLKILGTAAWIYVVDTNIGKIIRMIQNPIACISTSGTELVYKIKI
ncbi:hypothetical protein DOM21_07155 [Bacteriovorax stolpii]|uniref:protein NO VEIN domain-containing protein n=1 Tax=Bacteriovorax stolpii TaxID=960 RepID=UPI001159155C|nr:DUF3883 domain-containing protein [Bacteriovorax stolpii]QDK41237.1 hypothetical protein DOM21_07155 [Bacteriovorax stolpii]